MLTVAELAKELRVCRGTIYTALKKKDNKLPYYEFKFGESRPHIRFEERDVETYKQHFKRN